MSLPQHRTMSRFAGTVIIASLLLAGLAEPAAAAPSISGFSPTSGPAGCQVIISGSGFSGVTAITFNGHSATFTQNSSSQITATVAASATTGPIAVTQPNGTATSSSDFTVASTSCPKISSFSPGSGLVGTSVTVNGTNFTGVNAVVFNTTQANGYSVDSSTKITASVPLGATSGPIKVTASGGTGSSLSSFTVTSSDSFDVTSPPAPTISSFSPSSGPVGTPVTINGSNFVNVSKVTFSNVSASFTVNSSTKITATVPSGATDGRIRVTTPGGTATSSASFNVTTPPKPTISSFSPSSGPVGSSVTINGTNFSGSGFTTTAVKFNNVSSSFAVNSSTKITATVPSGATTGRISVTTAGGTATSAANFTVTGLTHSRSVSLQLRRHLRASGFVIVGDGFSSCATNVPVKIQRRRFSGGHWRTVALISTDSSGFYSAHLADRPGRYRARAVRLLLASGDVCARDTSGTRIHRV